MKPDAGHTYSVGEFAKLTGVTERTLRYYDRQQLLVPSSRNRQGHRIYSEDDLIRLQKIVTLKYLGFSLEEIARKLEENEQDLPQTLDMQYGLLKQKQAQLERVLATLERMRGIVEGIGRIDSTWLLMFIHSIHNEQEQKAALSKYLPESFISAMFMEHLGAEEKLQLERELATALSDLIRYCHAGRAVDDPEVLASGQRLIGLLNGIIGPGLQALSEESREKLATLNEETMAQDPAIFQTVWMMKKEEQFLTQVMERIGALELLAMEGESGHGS